MKQTNIKHGVNNFESIKITLFSPREQGPIVEISRIPINATWNNTTNYSNALRKLFKLLPISIQEPVSQRTFLKLEI